jgi:putative ABC transport system permease protein
MKSFKYILASVRHNVGLHAGTLAAAATASAVLVGALAVGDSVRGSLQTLASQRLGDTHLALYTGTRLLDRSLAWDLERASGYPMAPYLKVEGVLLTPGGDGERRSVNKVQVLGVEKGFWDLALADGAATLHPASGEMVLDERTAARLDLVAGDEAVLRLEVPSLLPRDAPLSARGERDTISFALEVSGIADDEHHGRFSLAQTQLPPRNVIVPLSWLQDVLDRSGAINGILAAHPEATVSGLSEKMDSVLSLGHGRMVLKEISDGRTVLTGNRVFLEPAVAGKALEIPGASGILHYLGIEIRAVGSGQKRDDRSGQELATPYPFVAAVTPARPGQTGPVPAGMQDTEIVVTKWLADALSLSAGDTLGLSYYRLTGKNRLVQTDRIFNVHSVLPMDEAVRERDAVPVYPGLSDVDRCRDWDIGMPLDRDRLSDPAIQEYWERYGMTPKAFVTLVAGRSMWGNRFGDITAVSYTKVQGGSRALEKNLNAALEPSDMGLAFSPVRDEALLGVEAAMDFGDLFLGLSFFLVVSALTLTAMLFSFSVLRRLPEIGTLLAVGFTRGRVTALVLGEGFTVALLGAVAGAPLGVLCTRALLAGLSSNWSGAVAQTPLALSVRPGTVAAGIAAASICSLAAMAVSIRSVLKQPPRALVTGALKEGREKRPSTLLWKAGLLLLAVGAALAWHSDPKGASSAGLFFAAGALMLISSLLLISQPFTWSRKSRRRFTMGDLSWRGVSRRRGRSVTVVGLVAVSCFLVFSVSAMKEDRTSLAGGRSSGTGGFALVAETTLPAPPDMNGKGTVDLGRNVLLPEGSSIVPFKVGPGDDASCFNLNKVIRPRLMGVDPELMSGRGAFNKGSEDVWRLLQEPLPGGDVPALAGDRDTAMWNLRVPVGVEKGERFTYTDDRGREVVVRLVGTLPHRKTVLQGKLLISLENFTKHFPDTGGWQYLLVDAKARDADKTKEVLQGALSRYGADVVPAARYLESYYQVENTYLTVFLVLGGLGVILGTIGLGAVVLRNALERQGELALLTAVGYSRSEVRRFLVIEHLVLLGSGMFLGTVCALVAVRPALVSSGSALPWAALGWLASAIVGVGVLSILGAVRLATSESIVHSLSKE